MHRIPFLTVVFATLFVLFQCPEASAFKRTHVGDEIQDFQLVTLDGEPWQIREHLGQKATVVLFWATWSPRSEKILADLQELYASQNQDGLQIIAVNTEHAEWDPDTLEKIKQVVASTPVDFPILVDRTLEAYAAYGVVAMPSALLADEKGIVVELLQGYPSSARVDFRDRVLETLGLRSKEPVREASASSEPPASPKVRRMVQMAKLFIKKRQPHKAIPVLEQALAEAPDFTEAYEILAEAFVAAGQPERAAEVEARRAKLAPSDEDRDIPANRGDTNGRDPSAPAAEEPEAPAK